MGGRQQHRRPLPIAAPNQLDRDGAAPAEPYNNVGLAALERVPRHCHRPVEADLQRLREQRGAVEVGHDQEDDEAGEAAEGGEWLAVSGRWHGAVVGAWTARW